MFDPATQKLTVVDISITTAEFLLPSYYYLPSWISRKEWFGYSIPNPNIEYICDACSFIWSIIMKESRDNGHIPHKEVLEKTTIITYECSYTCHLFIKIIWYRCS
jgi:hypothetical protein